jgi:hypothetical protein
MAASACRHAAELAGKKVDSRRTTKIVETLRASGRRLLHHENFATAIRIAGGTRRR